MADSPDAMLVQLFDAERKVRSLHDALAKVDEHTATEALSRALTDALKEADEREVAIRLVRIAGLLGEFEGPRAVDLLIDVLGSPSEEARSVAGAELEGLAFDRFKEVAKGVERALKRLPKGSVALPELPYLFAEVPEPGVIKILGEFSKHEDPDAVAAAIEVSVEIGDPAFVKYLRPLLDDTRAVSLADEGGESDSEVTIGELASEGIELLEMGSPDEGFDDEPPAPQGKPKLTVVEKKGDAGPKKGR